MTAVPTSALPEFKLLQLSSIVELANPRQSFGDLEELTASIAAHGVLEPLLVRPISKGYEVVAGARRRRAALAAGLKVVPCIVQARTDVEAARVALFENLSREDLSALDEGAAYRKLLDECGYTVEQLARETGKSRTVLFGRMRLAELKGEARELVAAGKLSASIGEMLARLPTQDGRDAALKRLRQHVGFHDDLLVDVDVRTARGILENEFNLKLARAPFDPEDDSLVSDEANCPGVCSKCPKRTGYEPELFPDTKDDTCLDGACWALKKAAAFKKRKLEVEAEGKKLLKDGAKLFNAYDNQLHYGARHKYATPSDKPEGSKKSWKDLLAEATPIVVAVDTKGEERELVDVEQAERVLKTLFPKEAERIATAKGPSSAELREQREADNRAAERVEGYVLRRVGPTATLDLAADLLLTALEASTWDWQGLMRKVGLPETTKLGKLNSEQRRAVLVAEAFGHTDFDTVQGMVERLAKAGKLDAKKLRKQAAKATAGTCWVCGDAKPKAWADGEAKTLCGKCGK